LALIRINGMPLPVPILSKIRRRSVTLNRARGLILILGLKMTLELALLSEQLSRPVRIRTSAGRCFVYPENSIRLGSSCWDGSRNAARAVADSVPFLAKAKNIEVVTLTWGRRKAII
jgi:hypothetical protein